MQRFSSPRSAQRFLSAYELIYEHARPKRHKIQQPIIDMNDIHVSINIST